MKTIKSIAETLSLRLKLRWIRIKNWYRKYTGKPKSYETISFPQTCYSTTSNNDTITITSLSPIANFTPGNTYSIGNSTTSTWGSSNTGTITLTGYSGTSTSNPCVVNIGAGYTNCWNHSTGFSSIIWGEDFIDRIPDLKRIDDMCAQYPALSLAWEKFKTTYRLVKDDYDNLEPRK